jgi:hypothetical protein
MPTKHSDTPQRAAQPSRTAWLASFVVPLAMLLALLCAAQPAQSEVGPVQLPGLSVTPQEEAEAEEFEEEEFEECGEEEAEEECEELEEEDSPYPPEACVLQTASAKVLASNSRNKVRLVVHYSSLFPTAATVEYRLKGGKGSLKVGEAEQRLDEQGTLHLSESLGKSAMAKVRAAQSFTVEMQIPGTSRRCRRFYDRHLTIKHVVHSQTSWLQSDSIFGTD